MTQELAKTLLEGKDVYLTEEGRRVLLELIEQEEVK